MLVARPDGKLTLPEDDLNHVDDGHERRGTAWRMLALLVVAELLGMSVWFAGSVVSPVL